MESGVGKKVLELNIEKSKVIHVGTKGEQFLGILLSVMVNSCISQSICILGIIFHREQEILYRMKKLNSIHYTINNTCLLYTSRCV